MEIQRNEGVSTSPGDQVVSLPFVVPLGSYLPATPGSDSSQVGVASTTNLSNTASVESAYAANSPNSTVGLVGVASPRASSESADMGPDSESISLGPLVSRGAAPIGPALATSIDDPAPSINRDEQGGRDSDVGRLESENGELVWRLRMLEAADRTAGRRLDPKDVTFEDDPSPLTTLKGLGGLPSLVAAFPRRRGPSHAEELASTLQPQADLVVVDEGPLNSTTDHQNQPEEIAKAGIATRAVGFLIALGLASGPLYPDLIALARRRLTRKRGAGSTSPRRFFRRRFPWPIS